MIRLSQRGWNNVIIFTTLILILLFNFSSDFLNRGLDDTITRTSLIPSDWVVTTIEFEQDTVERIGQGWRSKSGSLNLDDLNLLVSHWQNAQVQLFDSELNWQADSQVVKLWFVGQAEPIEYSFLSFADKTLVKFEQQTYMLISPDFTSLLVDN
ncbi:hypothetical protein [Paraglaciecola sp. L3A3]|uniref:hypothetical protein n=1 Tax=Paraglaciecola sp. L3A3 TaxID=2686358 RepID=UPI00131DD601|nr:hypothetical protein [Paraglaciecola sp. L3A3]